MADLQLDPNSTMPRGNHPGEPPNDAAQFDWDPATGALRLLYEGRVLFDGAVAVHSGTATLSASIVRERDALTQTLAVAGDGVRLMGELFAGEEAIVAETFGPAQQRFPLVRTVSGGRSRNLRNNAVYDRGRDWMLAGPAGATRIEPQPGGGLRIACNGNAVELTFKPRFYQRHRGLEHFRPWTHRVRQDSIAGWCSWWAYKREFTWRELDRLLAVWREKRLADYGYRFIQIDDGYQGGEHAGYNLLPKASYSGGHPETWLVWRSDRFPDGLAGYTDAVREAGFEPGVWIGSFFSDIDVATRHPDWFIRAADGAPFVAPWVSYAIDALNPEAAEALIHPTYRGLRQAGAAYVKIDSLRHFLYDNLNNNLEHCRRRGHKPADFLRAYLSVARRELGQDTFILACWGVLPEAIGLADGCRIGGDGYGPLTMQQYNSWNGIVWRNDPDHCDVLPQAKAVGVGNVTQTVATAASAHDTIIRPALASIAGCMLMLSDKAEVYASDANLHGLRRSAPVLFSVPGQLYDFDDSKAQALLSTPRHAITDGARPSVIDGDQFGAVCPWWLNEFDRPFEHWCVLHRLNWSDDPSASATVRLADLGLDAEKDYLVYEFWTAAFQGTCRECIELPGLGPMGLASYALRERLERPQIVSTNRHLSQGGADLIDVRWDGNALAGLSRVVAGDRYELAIHVPAPFQHGVATFGDLPVEIVFEGSLFRVACMPRITGELAWEVRFSRS